MQCMLLYLFSNKNVIHRGEGLNVKAKYKSIINSSSTGDILSAIVISIECIVASTVILVNIIN
jgi:hypothetical protein